MIGISTNTYDLSGDRILDKARATEEPEILRRVSRTGTLDGGAVVYDGGCSHADRTLRIKHDPYDDADLVFGRHIVENYSEIMVSTPFGVFLGTPANIRVTARDGLVMTILITEKL